MWNFLHSFQSPDVVEGFNRGREPAVETEKLVLNDCSQRKIVEELSQGLPDSRVAIFSAALVIEAIYLSDLARFMVSSQDGDSVFVANFQSNQ